MPDHYVTMHPNGWAVQSPVSKRVNNVHGMQHEAERETKRTDQILGRAEIRIQGRDDRWHDSDTVPSGNNPNPPRDKKH